MRSEGPQWGGFGARQKCAFCLAIFRHFPILVRILPKLAKRISGHFYHRRAVDLAGEKGSPESKPVAAAHWETEASMSLKEYTLTGFQKDGRAPG